MLKKINNNVGVSGPIFYFMYFFKIYPIIWVFFEITLLTLYYNVNGLTHFHDNITIPFDSSKKICEIKNKKCLKRSQHKVIKFLSLLIENRVKILIRHFIDTRTTLKQFWSDFLYYKLKKFITLCLDVCLKCFSSTYFLRSIQWYIYVVVKLLLHCCQSIASVF